MRKLCLGSLAAILAMLLLLSVVGCGDEEAATTTQAADTTTTAAQPASTTTTAAAQPADTTTTGPTQVKKLVLSNWAQPPEIVKFSSTFDNWAAEFKELTGGRYEVEVVHGGALSGVPDSYDAVINGIADIAHVIPQDTQRPFPMSEVVALPFYQVRSDIATQALGVLRAKGYFDAEFSEAKLLMMNVSASADELLTIKPVTGLADIKGMKLATGGGSRVELCERLGATPVFCPPPEIYSMLQKGVVDGCLMTGFSLYNDNTAEFLTTLVDPVRMFRISHTLLMNMDVYNSMPDDVKAIIDTMDADARLSMFGAKLLADEYDETMEKWLGSTGKMVTLNAEDTATLEAICKDIFEKWIADKEKAGLPGRQIVNDYYNALVELGVENPACGYRP